MSGIFLDLEQHDKFCEFVCEQEAASKLIVTDWFPQCWTEVDKKAISFAHHQYKESVDNFSRLLQSGNPDHYKRSGALLHALQKNKIITSLVLGNGPFGNRDDLESGFALVSYGDAQHVLKFADFYDEYHNQILAFESAFRCCCTYEEAPRRCDFDYLHNVCRYLKENRNLDVDSCFMIFKSLMI